jgi:5-methylcytosine-specific restriction endonuclease McrA
MKDGHINTCKSCRSDYDKKRPKRDPNYSKQYYQENKDKYRGYWWKHREKRLEGAKQWKRDNPEKVRENNRKRRALKMELNETYTKKDEAFTFTLFGNQCFSCGSDHNLAVDHNYPLSKGHKLERDNAVLLCSSCNSSKKDKLPEQFYSQEKLTKLDYILSLTNL